MADLNEYKCPCCGGAVEFSTSLQKLKCPYCDTEFDISTLQTYTNDVKQDGVDDLSWQKPDGSEWQPGESEGMRVYVCKSCGGEIVCDATTAASSCPYCDNPIVLAGQLSGALKPDLVIPFKLDKDAAKAAYKKHISGKRLLPKVFREDNHIDEIKGLYVPFWLFDADANANMRFKTTRTRTWSDSKNIYTETSFYSVVRAGSIGFDHIPVDGSSKMADELMESLEPFDMKDAVPFNAAYLAGFLADKYDVDADHCIERANVRIKRSAEEAFKNTVQGYASVETENSSVALNDSQRKYALYPVWLLNTTWNGQKYIFAMNGQTGKFVGDLPVDKGAAAKWTAGLTAGIGAAVFALLSLLYQLG